MLSIKLNVNDNGYKKHLQRASFLIDGQVLIVDVKRFDGHGVRHSLECHIPTSFSAR